MRPIHLDQALLKSSADGALSLIGRSSGVSDECAEETRRILAGWSGVAGQTMADGFLCARRVLSRMVMIVRTMNSQADVGVNGLHWSVLYLAPADYEMLGGDPFLISDQYSPCPGMAEILPDLSWTSEEPKRRTVEDVQRVLQRQDGPSLLGGTQALIDGGKIVFVRPKSDSALLRSLWTLLPTRTRIGLWPASYATSGEQGFNVAVTCRDAAGLFQGYLNEDQTAEYPEGHYELSLQVAAEAENQHELDRLFRRRSRMDTLKLGLWLLGACVAILLASRFVIVDRPSTNGPTTPPFKDSSPSKASNP